MESNWIDVKDELPEPDALVLMWIPEGTPDVVQDLWQSGYWDGMAWRFSDSFIAGDAVTHWQPLPEPPTATQQGTAADRSRSVSANEN